MEITTFLFNEIPRHDDNELAKYINKISTITGLRWCVRTRYEMKCNPNNIEIDTELFEQRRGKEYKKILSVRSIREAKAFLLGALSVLNRNASIKI